jgi:hypothetical protein
MSNPERKGSSLRWRFEESAVSIVLDRWREERGHPTAECVVYKGLGILSQGRLNLTSTTAQRSLVKDLQEKTKHEHPPLKWALMVQMVCTQALACKREGEPVEPLSKPLHPIVLQWRCFPLVHEGLPTVLFGPGGIGKSYLGLLTALIVERGGNRLSFAGVPGRTLYLDWEMEQVYLQDRAEKLRQGHLDLDGAEPLYRRCESPLADELSEIAELIDQEQIKYLVIDSLAPACGAELAAPETAIRFFRALRSLRCSALVLAHVAKNAEAKSIYGSVFFTNLARSVWELEGDGDGTLALYHRKSNLSARQAPMGLSLQFGPEAVQFLSMDLADIQTVRPPTQAEEAIKGVLLEGPKMPKEIEDQTDLPGSTVRMTLKRGIGKWSAKLDSGQWCLLKTS